MSISQLKNKPLTFFLTILVTTLLITFKLWIISFLPSLIIPENTFDDFLNVKLGNEIIEGRWLGQFDKLTLAKGPLYPFFVAASYRVSLSVVLLQQVIFIVASLFVSFVLTKLVNHHKKGVFLFSLALLLFHPISLDIKVGLRVNRPGLYFSLTLFTLSFLTLGLIVSQLKKKMWLRYLPLALSGIFLGLCWCTREETIWLVPPFIFSLAILLYSDFKNKKYLHAIFPSVIISLCFFFTLFPFLKQNKEKYGHYILTEFQHSAFISAYGSLTRVKDDNPIPYVPVSRNVRNKIAAVSPAFRELNVFFEGDLGTNWVLSTQSEAPLKGGVLDIGGGVFMWALRDAAVLAGHYDSLDESIKFYTKLSNEVNASCDRKELICNPRRDTLFPPWNHEYLQNIIFYTKTLSAQLISPSVSLTEKSRTQPEINYWLTRHITSEEVKSIDTESTQYKFIYSFLSFYVFISKCLYALSGVTLVLIFYAHKKDFLRSIHFKVFCCVFLSIVSLSAVLILLSAMSLPYGTYTGYSAPLFPLWTVLVIIPFLYLLGKKNISDYFLLLRGKIDDFMRKAFK